MTKTTALLLVFGILCMTLAACTAAEIAGTTAAVTASAGAIVEAVKPLLSPEDAARLTMIASKVDGTVQATATALTEVCNVIGTFHKSATTQFAAVHDAANALAVKVAEAPTMGDVAYVSGTASAGSTALGGAALNAMRNASRAKVLPKVA